MSNDNKEAKKEELLEKQEARKLTDDELAQVRGGFTDNGNGTYNIYAGDRFCDGKMSFTSTETKLNVTETDHIECDWFHIDSDGNLNDYGHSSEDVHSLLVGLR